MDRRLEIRMARRRVGNNMVSPDLMTWKQPGVDSLRHTSYAAASRSCQLAGTFSWSAVWSFVGRGHNWDPSAPCFLKTLLLGTEVNTHTHGLKGKARKPQRNKQPEKGTAAKVTHKQKRKRKKDTPETETLTFSPRLQNLLARKGQVEGIPSLRSQEGLATPGARLQPTSTERKKKKEKTHWGDRPLAEGMASKAVSYWKRTSGVPKSPSSLVTTHDRRNLRQGLFVKFRVSRSKFVTSADIANSSEV